MDERKLKQLKKLMEAVKDSDDDSDSEDGQTTKQQERNLVNAKISSTVNLLYAASKLKIYKIADKIASCAVSKEEKVFQEYSEVSIPVAESWDFRLGDKVKIKYSLKDFKSIQCRTLGWNARLRNIHGCVGIVTERSSIFENSVKIYTPARLSSSSLYAGLLEKIAPDEDDDPVPSHWKVDQYVTTKMDLKVVKLMQRRLDDIPMKCLGCKGRIIAVTRVAVVVTFDEKTSYDINSYLLVLCPDQTAIEEKEVEHTKGFKVGDKVSMLSNFKKLVDNQKDTGGWNESMSNIAGKIVTVTSIEKDGTLDVQYKLGRTWRVSPESAIKLEDVQPEGRDIDIPIIRRDIVKIKMVENIRMLLEANNVPLVFLEYLRNTAEVKLVDDDFDYLIRYNCDQNVSAYAPTVRKATEEEKETHSQIKAIVKTLQVGSEVYLDVGPPNFVTAMLKEVNASREVIRALTNPAKLVGYAKDNRAIIEYDDGRRYKIKKKFLTIPDKFKVYDATGGLDYETVKEIQQMVGTSAQIVNDDQERPSNVKILSMAYGTPSTIDLRVHSVSATAQRICETLSQICDWQIDVPCDGVFYINKMESYPNEIKVCLFFNEDEYVPHKIPAEPSMSEPKEENLSVKEGTAAPAAALPDLGPEAARGPIPERPNIHQPEVKSFEQFQFFHLFDPFLERNVFLPYVIQGQRQQGRRTFQDDDQEHRDVNRERYQSITNTFNIGNVENLKNFNN